MSSIKTTKEIDIMRAGGKILATILQELQDMARPGVSTKELEAHAKKRIEDFHARSAFHGYKGGGDIPFPAVLCASINAEVVHAPALQDRVFQDGDIVGLDFGIQYPASDTGLYTDMAVTVGIGNISRDAKRLIDVTRRALQRGLTTVRPGNYVHDISRAIQKFVRRYGYGIVREFVGHGVGHAMHEPPEIFNYYHEGHPRVELKEGMCLAIEPMVTLRDPAVEVLEDGWTAITKDRSIAAHFELTVVVAKSGYEVLTKA